MTTSNKSILYYINAIFFMLIPFIFFQLEPVEPLTEVGMKVVGVFVCLLYGWVTIGLIWPSIYGLLMLAFTGYFDNMNAIFSASFGNSTTVLLIFMLAFAGLVEYSGVSKFISMWFITRKIVIGRPWLFSFMLLFSVYILGSLTSGTPSVLLGWSLLAGVCAAVGLKPGEKWPKLMFFGILIAGPLGMDLFPFKPVSIVALQVFTSYTGMEISYVRYICCALILDTLIMAGYLLFARFVEKPDVSKLRDVTPEKLNAAEALKLSIEQKIILVLTVFLLAGFILPSFLPKEWMFTIIFKKWGTTGTIMFVMMLFVFLRIKGEAICNFGRAAKQGISWDAIMLTASVLCVTGAVSNDATGFVPFFKGLVEPFLEGKSMIIFILLMLLIATAFTNLCTNAGTAAALSPIVLAMGSIMGANLAFLIIMVVKCCHFAYFTPAASPATALCIANKEWIDQKSIVKYGLVTVIIAFVVIMTIGMAVGNVIFSNM